MSRGTLKTALRIEVARANCAQFLVSSSGIKTAKSPACRVMATLFQGWGDKQIGLTFFIVFASDGPRSALMPSQPVITTPVYQP